MKKIYVEYVTTDIHYDYRPEYQGFILRRYDAADSRWNSVLLSGACLWDIERLQRVLKLYEKAL